MPQQAILSYLPRNVPATRALAGAVLMWNMLDLAVVVELREADVVELPQWQVIEATIARMYARSSELQRLCMPGPRQPSARHWKLRLSGSETRAQYCVLVLAGTPLRETAASCVLTLQNGAAQCYNWSQVCYND